MTEDAAVDVVDALIGMRAVIEHEEDWCQRLALNAFGQRCMLGAAFFYDATMLFYVCKALAETIGYPDDGPQPSLPVIGYNDSHTHTECLDLIDRTIVRKRAERGVTALADVVGSESPTPSIIAGAQQLRELHHAE